MRSADERFMREALVEARRGLGRTHPNPAVGAVIVRGGKIVGRGFHAKAGTPHAEVHALADAGAAARGATLYVTLEPCDHHGRTPPCTAAILRAGVRRVVFASSDPNPLVNGKGLARLRRAGVALTAHVLQADADALNRPFFKAMRERLPFVTLKAGVSADGKIATARGESQWITSEEARADVHALRDVVDAVVVGVGTVLADDPRLTTRLPGGAGRTPLRVVLDPRLRAPLRARVFDVGPERRTLLITTRSLDAPKARALLRRGVEVWSLPARGGVLPLKRILAKLVERGALHVLVEGGAATHAQFVRAGLADEARLYVAPRLIGGDGLSWLGAVGRARMRDVPHHAVVDVARLGPDVRLTVALRDAVTS